MFSLSHALLFCKYDISISVMLCSNSYRNPLELHPPTILGKVPRLTAHSQVNIKLSFNHIIAVVVVSIVVSRVSLSISLEGSQSLHEQTESISEEERRRDLQSVEEEG